MPTAWWWYRVRSPSSVMDESAWDCWCGPDSWSRNCWLVRLASNKTESTNFFWDSLSPVSQDCQRTFDKDIKDHTIGLDFAQDLIRTVQNSIYKTQQVIPETVQPDEMQNMPPCGTKFTPYGNCINVFSCLISTCVSTDTPTTEQKIKNAKQQSRHSLQDVATTNDARAVESLHGNSATETKVTSPTASITQPSPSLTIADCFQWTVWIDLSLYLVKIFACFLAPIAITLFKPHGRKGGRLGSRSCRYRTLTVLLSFFVATSNIRNMREFSSSRSGIFLALAEDSVGDDDFEITFSEDGLSMAVDWFDLELFETLKRGLSNETIALVVDATEAYANAELSAYYNTTAFTFDSVILFSESSRLVTKQRDSRSRRTLREGDADDGASARRRRALRRQHYSDNWSRSRAADDADDLVHESPSRHRNLDDEFLVEEDDDLAYGTSITMSGNVTFGKLPAPRPWEIQAAFLLAMQNFQYILGNITAIRDTAGKTSSKELKKVTSVVVRDAWSPMPSEAPTNHPTTPFPTSNPTDQPTVTPSHIPTNVPTTMPPTPTPTAMPTTQAPTEAPSTQPTEAPTSTPTSTPTTAAPTIFPTNTPSMKPTDLPTSLPSILPTPLPTSKPTTPPKTPQPTASPFAAEQPIAGSSVAPTLSRRPSSPAGIPSVPSAAPGTVSVYPPTLSPTVSVQPTGVNETGVISIIGGGQPTGNVGGSGADGGPVILASTLLFGIAIIVLIALLLVRRQRRRKEFEPLDRGLRPVSHGGYDEIDGWEDAPPDEDDEVHTATSGKLPLTATSSSTVGGSTAVMSASVLPSATDRSTPTGRSTTSPATSSADGPDGLQFDVANKAAETASTPGLKTNNSSGEVSQSSGESPIEDKYKTVPSQYHPDDSVDHPSITSMVLARGGVPPTPNSSGPDTETDESDYDTEDVETPYKGEIGTLGISPSKSPSWKRTPKTAATLSSSAVAGMLFGRKLGNIGAKSRRELREEEEREEAEALAADEEMLLSAARKTPTKSNGGGLKRSFIADGSASSPGDAHNTSTPKASSPPDTPAEDTLEETAAAFETPDSRYSAGEVQGRGTTFLDIAESLSPLAWEQHGESIDLGESPRASTGSPPEVQPTASAEAPASCVSSPMVSTPGKDAVSALIAAAGVCGSIEIADTLGLIDRQDESLEITSSNTTPQQKNSAITNRDMLSPDSSKSMSAEGFEDEGWGKDLPYSWDPVVNNPGAVLVGGGAVSVNGASPQQERRRAPTSPSVQSSEDDVLDIRDVGAQPGHRGFGETPSPQDGSFPRFSMPDSQLPPRGSGGGTQSFRSSSNDGSSSNLARGNSGNSAIHPMDWSNRESEGDELTSHGDSTLSEIQNGGGIGASPRTADVGRKGLYSSPFSNSKSLRGAELLSPRTPDPSTPHSAASHTTDNCSADSSQSSRQLINDLMWLEKKIADGRALTAAYNSNIPRVSSYDEDEEETAQADSSNNNFSGRNRPPPSPMKPTPPSTPPIRSAIVRDCFAPPGKLNIVIHSTSSGPAVYSVQEGSALKGHVFTGDIITSVDNIDTTQFSAEKVMKMMTERSDRQRKITVLHYSALNSMD